MGISFSYFFTTLKKLFKLIFSKEYTFAEEKSWHIDHFCCFGCDKHLGGHRYITKEDQSYCIDCYMEKFARVFYFSL